MQTNTKIPIHGDGSYIRDWIDVRDNVQAIYHLITEAKKNEIYNIAADNHLTNLEVVEQVCSWYGIRDIKEHINFTENRLGQDVRYSISSDKLFSTGFTMSEQSGIKKFI